MSVERALVCPDCEDTGSRMHPSPIVRDLMKGVCRKLSDPEREPGPWQGRAMTTAAEMAYGGCHTCGRGLEDEQ